MNKKTKEKLPRPTYTRRYVTFLVSKNKKLVFILIFITVTKAYLTPDGKKHNPNIKTSNKIIYYMLSDVIKTAKYGTTTKENALQILSHIQILFLHMSNA